MCTLVKVLMVSIVPRRALSFTMHVPSWFPFLCICGLCSHRLQSPQIHTQSCCRRKRPQGGLRRLCGINHNVAGDMPISFGMALLCNRFVQLWLNHFLEGAAFLNNSIEIRVEWTVNKVSIGLFDGSFPEVVSYLHVTFSLPLCS